jgi:DNA-binding NarL/FixJ family response regulator
MQCYSLGAKGGHQISLWRINRHKSKVLDMDDFSSFSPSLPSFSEDAPVVSERFEPSAGVDARTSVAPDPLRLALIDTHNLTRECFLGALSDVYQGDKIFGFSSVDECIAQDDSEFDLIVYYSHGSEASLSGTSQLRRAYESAKLVVLSDLEDGRQTATIRDTLANGANGFISTQSTSLAMTLAAIQFVQSGGTYVPTDILLNERTAPAATQPVVRSPRQLTARQVHVMELLQLGKANKIIAFDLGMSESTVKVHVRNIMRKMGATNRTQAAFAGYRQTGGATNSQWASA